MRLTTVLVALLTGIAPQAASQSTWCRYEARQLTEIIAQHEEGLRLDAPDTGTAGWHFTADQFPSRAIVVRGDSVRRLANSRKELINRYFNHFIHRPVPDDMFQHEVLFLEGRDSLWLPLQESLMPDLLREAAPGDSVVVFAAWLGAVSTAAGDIDWVFIVNEFGTKSSAAEWTTALAGCHR